MRAPVSFLLILFNLVSAQESCSLGATTKLKDGLFFLNVVDSVRGTATVQLIYEGQAWLGLGVSEEGYMDGSDAVIGVPTMNSSATNPGLYRMTAQNVGGVNLLDSTYQTLQDATIYQNDTHTVLTFTKVLVESDQVEISATSDNIWIYAVGTSNEFPAVHRTKGAFRATLNPCGSDGTASSADSTSSPTPPKWFGHLLVITMILASALE